MDLRREMKRLMFAPLILALSLSAQADTTTLIFSRNDLEKRWQNRITSFLNKNQIPKIDLETSLSENHLNQFIPDIFPYYDQLGIAITVPDGYGKKGSSKSRYIWSDYITKLVNKYPSRFATATNGGTNKNWLDQRQDKHSYIYQLEQEVKSGQYFALGEIDFKHYMSNEQCSKGKYHRHSEISLDSELGNRIFKLSSDYNLPLLIHLEAEDKQFSELKKMLKKYPKSNVVVAHFGQLRQPEKQQYFNPLNIEKLLKENTNLFFDLAVGQPNRKYKCSGANLDKTITGDTVLWETKNGRQTTKIDKEWLSLISKFSDRFVFSSDFGGSRGDLRKFLKKKVNTFELIISDLPLEAKHNISYRNAWRLLTGREWER